jgi:hypothetical protein
MNPNMINARLGTTAFALRKWLLAFLPLAVVLTALLIPANLVSARGTPSDADIWATLPFTAREWARQTLLPYRKVPLKNGGAMPIQEAYDLYLKAGQPDYPDMSTPGLVTPEEVAQQIRLSRIVNRVK